MTISTRIAAGFGILIAIILALGLYSLTQLGELKNTLDRIVDRDVATLRLVEATTADEGAMRNARTRAIIGYLAGRPIGSAQDNWQAASAEVSAQLDSLTAATAQYRATATSSRRADSWQQLSDASASAKRIFDSIGAQTGAQFAAIARDDRAQVLELDDALVRQQDNLGRALEQVRTELDRTVTLGREVAAERDGQTRNSILLGLLAAVLIALVVAYTIRRSIIEPLTDFVGFSARVGDGDLTGVTSATGKDELGRLGLTLNTMVEGLREMAAQSRQATENLNAAATEIRASTQEQVASVEEQLAAVQETAATVDEITQSGAQISRRAQEVITSAQATARTSEKGIAAVDDTARAMDGIREQAETVAANIVALSEKTQAIGDIIATVNDVSERSHLLALNASIEAAAAGEQGRSFAVVAAEMKTLADQAKEATRDVRAILGDIQRGINSSVMLTEEAVKRVASGKERTDATQSAIEEMAHRIQESVQTFQQIVASTNQQQIGIEQVTVALQNIRQASQQTAASTRQLDQAAGDLANLSRVMVGLTERYRT